MVSRSARQSCVATSIRDTRWGGLSAADRPAHGDFPAVDCCEDAECTGTPVNGSTYCNQGTCSVACDEGYAVDDDGACVVACPTPCGSGYPGDVISDGPCDGVCCPSGCFCALHAGGLGLTCFAVGGPSPVVECYQDPTNPHICPDGSACYDAECFFLCEAM